MEGNSDNTENTDIYEQENASLIEEFWNTPSLVDYGSWDNAPAKKERKFKLKRKPKKKKNKYPEIKEINDDFELGEEKNKELLNQFWEMEIDKETDFDIKSFIKKYKTFFAAFCIIFSVFLLFIIKSLLGAFIFNHSQKAIYDAAQLQMKTGNFVSAKNYFMQIDEKSSYYFESDKKIKQIESAQKCIDRAESALDEDDIDLAQAEINSAKLIIDNFSGCEEIQDIINEKEQEKVAAAKEYIEKCRKAIDDGNMPEAVKNYSIAYDMAKNSDEVKNLYADIREYALERLEEGENYYDEGNILQAQIIFNEIKQIGGFSESNRLYSKLSSYHNAVKLIKQAEEKFNEGDNEAAKELINQAWEMNEFSKPVGEELAEKINKALEEEKISQEYKSNLKISSLSFIENEADGKAMTTAMFDIELTGLDIFIFNACWITIEKGEAVFQATPMHELRYAVVVKILENGQTAPDLEYDIVYIKKGEKYRVMLKFEGKKDDFKDAKLIYTDYNDENSAKIELGDIK